MVVFPCLGENVEAEARRVHHHHREHRLQQQGGEGVDAKHQGVALHAETGGDLIAEVEEGGEGKHCKKNHGEAFHKTAGVGVCVRVVCYSHSVLK